MRPDSRSGWAACAEAATYFRETHRRISASRRHPTTCTDEKLSDVPSEATNLHSPTAGDLHRRIGHTSSSRNEKEEYIATYYRPTNNSLTEKQGIEYSFDPRKLARPAHLADHRRSVVPYQADRRAGIRFEDQRPTTTSASPAGSGTLQNRVNTTPITHPAAELVFSTTMQVVWYESQQNIWQDGSGNDLSLRRRKFMSGQPVGFYDKQGKMAWQKGIRGRPSTPRWSASPSRPPRPGAFRPWVMFNFRLDEGDRASPNSRSRPLHAHLPLALLRHPHGLQADLPRHVFRCRTETAYRQQITRKSPFAS